MRRALAFASLLLAAGACSGKGNSGRKEIDPALIAQVPWINGAPPLVDPASGQALLPSDPQFPPIGPGGVDTPDPGSRLRFDTEEDRKKNCAEVRRIVPSAWQLNFEPFGVATVGVAPFFAVYDDHTEGSWHTPEDAAFYAGFGSHRDATSGIWGTAASQIVNGPSCDGAANNWALHVRGGRFNYFGGGAEHPFFLDCPTQPGACELSKPILDDTRPEKVFDVSQFTGIAFWARRGPDGITGLQILLQDKYTSDRLARSGESGTPGLKNCSRIKQCYPTCADGAMCTPVETDGRMIDRCVPTKVDAAGNVVPALDPTDSMMEPALLWKLYPPCGASACATPNYDRDYDYDHTLPEPYLAQCKPYNFTGLDENYWCFGDKSTDLPTGDRPAAPDERCGDGFVSNISLSTDWQFYKLPFAAFQQVGFGKKVPPEDDPTKTLYSIAFLFSVGYTDFFVDNITFYNE